MAIKDTIEDNLDIIGKKVSPITPSLEKSDASKNITLSDWNTLVIDVAYTEKDVDTLAKNVVTLAGALDDSDSSLRSLWNASLTRITSLSKEIDEVKNDGSDALIKIENRVESLEAILPDSDIDTSLPDRIAAAEALVETLKKSKLDAAGKDLFNRDRLYAVTSDGDQVRITYSSDTAKGNTIVQRNANGQIVIANPTAYDHAVTKAFVDGAVSDVEKAANELFSSLDNDLENLADTVTSVNTTVGALSKDVTELKGAADKHTTDYKNLANKVSLLDGIVTGGSFDDSNAPGIAAKILETVNELLASEVSDAVSEAFDANVVSDTGNSDELVMSQNAVTTKLTEVNSALSNVNAALGIVSKNITTLNGDLESVTAKLDTKMPTISHAKEQLVALTFANNETYLTPVQHVDDVDSACGGYTIACRDGDGRLQANLPKKGNDVVTKEYLGIYFPNRFPLIANFPSTGAQSSTKVLNQYWVTSAIEALNGVVFDNVNSKNNYGIDFVKEKLDKDVEVDYLSPPRFLYARAAEITLDDNNVEQLTPTADAFLAVASSLPGTDTIIKCDSNGYYLCQDPQAPLEVANKRYVDAKDATKLDKNLVYNSDIPPTYIYARQPVIEDGVAKPEGDVMLAFASEVPIGYALIRCSASGYYSCYAPKENMHVANKQYVDDAIAKISGGSGSAKLYRHECRLDCVDANGDFSLACYFSFISSTPTSLGTESYPIVNNILTAMAGVSVSEAKINCQGTVNGDQVYCISFTRTSSEGTITVEYGYNHSVEGEGTFAVDNGYITDSISSIA